MRGLARRGLMVGAVVLALPLMRMAMPRAAAMRVLPLPALDERGVLPASETIVLAGGCFWGVQGVFQHVVGVISAVSGYAGGEAATAQYETVSGGQTGHAESVRVTFDPRRISLGHVLNVYFSVAHDPTEHDRQGPDSGTQYRSTIFAADAGQAAIARAYIAQLNGAHVFGAPIATTVETGRRFFPAEAYHQDFLTLNPDYPYIAVNDMPKVAALKRLLPDEYRAEPVLVGKSAT